MPVDDFDTLVRDLKARKVEHVVINGHGETTMLPNWAEKVEKIADAGVSMAIISNFARLMSEDELEAMALKSNIQISIDTHRPDLLRKLRRKVDVRHISGIFLELRHNRQERP
jgi:wyosine [tRNA(Phe)-imidazoG37] synthetase (radical SAM superfamily)